MYESCTVILISTPTNSATIHLLTNCRYTRMGYVSTRTSCFITYRLTTLRGESSAAITITDVSNMGISSTATACIPTTSTLYQTLNRLRPNKETIRNLSLSKLVFCNVYEHVKIELILKLDTANCNQCNLTDWAGSPGLYFKV